MIERSLVLLKPDTIQRALIGDIIKRFEQRGLKIVGMKMQWIDENFAKKHYTDDIEKRHSKMVRDKLLRYIISGPIVALVLEGIDAISIVRKIVGSTYPNEAPVGTIRGDFAHMSKLYADSSDKTNIKNLIHASGNKEEAEQEINLWFKKEELHSYKTVHDLHIF